jgi:transcriptional regulator with XRE-family HTH domain
MKAMGDFLRLHRKKLSQSELVGDELKRRRRTPGLRREEIAQLANISSTWYTRLEQGKEISPSGSTLSRIAKVMRLTAAERNYIFDLAGRVDPEEFQTIGEKALTAETDEFITAIASPAYLLDRYWTPRVWNHETSKIFSLWLEGPEINLLRHMFLDPQARHFVVEWEHRSRQLIAQFRIDYARNIDDPKMVEIVEELNAESTFFRDIWNEQEVQFRERKVRSYNHPVHGHLRFKQNTFLGSVDRSLKLVILTPTK